MTTLLFKEIRLCAHPTSVAFAFLGCLVLVPAYPYSVIFLFGCLAPYITFVNARATNDAWYTATLPVTKREMVRAKCLLTVSFQLFQLLFSVPFALLRRALGVPNNPVGLDATASPGYGLGLMIYAVFDLVFLPAFYKSGYKAGKAFVTASVPLLLGMIAAESTAHIPALAWMDSDEHWRRQLPVLAAAWPVTRPFCRWHTEGRPNALNGWICRTGRPESTRNTEAGRRAGERTETWKQPLCLRIRPRAGGEWPNPPHMTELHLEGRALRSPHGKSPRAVSFEGFLGAATGIAMQPERRARPDAKLSRSAFGRETALRSGMDAAGDRRGSARPGRPAAEGRPLRKSVPAVTSAVAQALQAARS